MEKVIGAESPPSAFTTGYNGIKTQLVQMQIAGQGIIETLKSYTDLVDNIIAQKEYQAPKPKWRPKFKTGDSGQHKRNQKTRDSLQKTVIAQMQSMLQSIEMLGVLIQTIVKHHFSESFHQSLEKSLQQTVQNCDTSAFISRDKDNQGGETGDDQVHGIGGHLIKNHSGAVNVDKQEGLVSLPWDVRSLEDQLKTTMNKPQSQLNTDTETVDIQSIKERLSSIEHQTQDDKQSITDRFLAAENLVKKLSSKLKTKSENFQSVETKLHEIEQRTADNENSIRSQLSKNESQNKGFQLKLNSNTEYIKSIEFKLSTVEHQIADVTNSFRAQHSTLENQNKELQSVLNTKIEYIQSIEANLREIEQQTADETNRCRAQLSTLKSQNTELQSQLNSKTENVKSLEAELQSCKQQTADETNSFRSKLSTLNSQNRELQSQLNSQTEYVKSIEEELRSCKQQTADETNSFRSKLSSLESHNRELQSQLNSQTENVKSLEAELRSCKQQTANETNSFRSKLSTLNSQNRELQSQLNSKTEYVKSIEAELRSCKLQIADETNSLRHQLSASEDLNKELQLKLRTETEYHDSILCEKMKTCRQQEDNICFLTDKIHDLKNTLQTIQTENSHLNEQLRRQRTVDLQIWFQRTDILTQVAGEIQEQVKTKCKQTANMVVNCFTPDAQAELQPCKPTLVLCINASRLGTDVSKALDNLQGSPAVAVIVLHHKAMHALPNQSSDKVLTSPEYKELGGVFDMAFLAGQGLYHCSMNDMALNKILEFLKYSIFQRELMK